MWNLPRPGIKPVSPSSAGGFLSTLPPGKSWDSFENGGWGRNRRKILRVVEGMKTASELHSQKEC